MASVLPISGTADSTARSSGLANARMPHYGRALLEALRFSGSDVSRLQTLSTEQWKTLLAFCDVAQLTLTMNYVCRAALPKWVRERIDGNIQTYSKRFSRLRASLLEIGDSLETRGIEFIVLKGLSHAPHFTPDPLLRSQGDIDIWCSPESVTEASKALQELGYRSLGHSKGRHLPPMIRETGWEWRGDFYASELPIAVELHYRLWDEDAEAICAPGEQLFWERRVSTSIEGRTLTVLFKPDMLAFASLHLLMHLLHGDLRLQRAWEIANFLNTHCYNGAFWSLWRRCHSESLRRLQAIVFELVSIWFAVDPGPVAQEEFSRLPGDVKLWAARYSWSPIEALFQPNKDEIWLHLSLVRSLRDKCSIFARRILPLSVPERIDEGTLREEMPNPRQLWRYFHYLASRALHHSRAFCPALSSGIRWYWTRLGLGSGLLRYLAASVLFCCGVSTFFLLYNLYLLNLGFREDLLGKVAGCVGLGTVVGAVPAAILMRRSGLRKALQIAIFGTAATTVLRAFSVQPDWLIATAFLSGLFLSLWAVSFSPAVAGLTNEANRPRAFGVACATGVCAGVLGGLIGGHLPGLLGGLLPHLRSLSSFRGSLLAASCIAAMAAWPAGALRFQRVEGSEPNVYPRNRFIITFLVPLSCWSLAVGSFNPFFNAFFAQRLQMGVKPIGLVLSVSQICQASSMILAPAVIRRFGHIRSITGMQLATGLALIFLALSPTAGLATAGYLAYMSFQYMSEPGLLNLLMSRVAPVERGGASAVYFLVTSLAASVAAALGGGAVVRFGYPAVLVGAGLLVTFAAMLFCMLVPEKAPRITSPTSS